MVRPLLRAKDFWNKVPVFFEMDIEKIINGISNIIIAHYATLLMISCWLAIDHQHTLTLAKVRRYSSFRRLFKLFRTRFPFPLNLLLIVIQLCPTPSITALLFRTLVTITNLYAVIFSI